MLLARANCVILNKKLLTWNLSWLPWLALILDLEQGWCVSQQLSTIQHFHPGGPKTFVMLFIYLVMKRITMYKVEQSGQTLKSSPALTLSPLGITETWTALTGQFILSFWLKIKKQAIWLMPLLKWPHLLCLLRGPVQVILGWQWYNVLWWLRVHNHQIKRKEGHVCSRSRTSSTVGGGIWAKFHVSEDILA